MYKLLITLLCFAIGFSTPLSAYSPPAGAKFNIPPGTSSQQYAILNHINLSIDSSPKGSIIRIATYAIDKGTTVDKLIAAHKRGVHVKILFEGHMANSYTTKLQTALGKNTAARSFAKSCRASCFSATGDLHAKMYLFSTAGSSSRVTMIGSANLTDKNARTGWNNLFTTVGDTTMYDFYRDRFTAMTKDQNVTNPYTAKQSGQTAAYLYPRQDTGTGYDPMYNELSRVTCTGVTGAYGTGGRTIIHVAMFGWMNTRLKVAEKLWQLDDAGCVVDVIVDYNLYTATNNNSGHIQDKILPALLKPGGRNGGIRVYDGHFDSDGNGRANYYMHSKYILINGRYGSSPGGTVVFTGSQNLSYASIFSNSEIMIRNTNVDIYRAYAGNFAKMKPYAHVMKTAPPSSSTAAKSSPLTIDQTITQEQSSLADE